jgi:hypothetical protein
MLNFKYMIVGFLCIISILMLIYKQQKNIENFTTDIYGNKMFIQDQEFTGFHNFYNPNDFLYKKISYSKPPYEVEYNSTSNDPKEIMNPKLKSYISKTLDMGTDTYKNESYIDSLKTNELISNMKESGLDIKNHDLKYKIINKQHRLLNRDSLHILNNNLYHDDRFPEEPVNFNFAINPDEYCKNNKMVYPCYKYYSRY